MAERKSPAKKAAASAAPTAEKKPAAEKKAAEKKPAAEKKATAEKKAAPAKKAPPAKKTEPAVEVPAPPEAEIVDDDMPLNRAERRARGKKKAQAPRGNKIQLPGKRDTTHHGPRQWANRRSGGG